MKAIKGGSVLFRGFGLGDNAITCVDTLSNATNYAYDALNRPISIRFGGADQPPLREDRTYSARDELASISTEPSPPNIWRGFP